MGEIWAVILAAGESKRMGFPKMLLPFNGSTMLECVINSVSQSKIDKVIIVLGAEKESLIQLAEKLKIEYCYNENYKEGMLSSVQCGFRKLPEDCTACIVFQGDQPLINSDVIDTIIEAYRASDKGIVIPVFNKKRGHPVLIDIKYRHNITALNPAKGLRSLASVFSEDVLEVETHEPGILRDFDTYQQYLKGINQIY
jgi:molybdenum cofactor cytidylyltransferase